MPPMASPVRHRKTIHIPRVRARYTAPMPAPSHSRATMRAVRRPRFSAMRPKTTLPIMAPAIVAEPMSPPSGSVMSSTRSRTGIAMASTMRS